VDERREVYFAGEGRRATPVFARAALKPGNRLAGPALIEQYDSCTLVAPGWDAIVDRFGNLLLTKDGVRAGD
jgi:N-methylhydantoinase A